MLHSYSQIYNPGHRAVKDLFNTEVLIEEKVDGSQFSFGKINGELFMRSKGAILHQPVTDKLFKSACEYVISLEKILIEGYTYRGEVLARPRHNTLEYGRIPLNGIIIYDIDRGDQDYLSYDDKFVEAVRIGLETVPRLFQGKIENPDQLKAFFERESLLGKAKIEGMVIKNYSMFGIDKKTLMGKWVSEAFKEVHNAEWKSANPSRADFVDQMIKGLKTEARWEKAIQHLRDDGKLTDSPADIGNLLKEIQADVKKEMEGEIKDKLFSYYWPKIARGVIGGFPEHYKNKLAQKQFDEALPGIASEIAEAWLKGGTPDVRELR